MSTTELAVTEIEKKDDKNSLPGSQLKMVEWLRNRVDQQGERSLHSFTKGTFSEGDFIRRKSQVSTGSLLRVLRDDVFSTQVMNFSCPALFGLASPPVHPFEGLGI